MTYTNPYDPFAGIAHILDEIKRKKAPSDTNPPALHDILRGVETNIVDSSVLTTVEALAASSDESLRALDPDSVFMFIRMLTTDYKRLYGLVDDHHKMLRFWKKAHPEWVDKLCNYKRSLITEYARR